MKRLRALYQRIRSGRWFGSSRRLRWTGVGLGYLAAWVGLLITGLQQQRNLILLTTGMAAGPLVASFVMSAGMLRKVRVSRRMPDQAFAGEPLVIEYMLENDRRVTAALAVEVSDQLVPTNIGVPGTRRIHPNPIFERVPPRARERLRWQGPAPVRGEYRFNEIDLVSRAPFGLVERRETTLLPERLIVYPQPGRLTAQWRRLQREATQTRRGSRHDRTAQQQEYHGLRDYRPGDSLRWIHWRTSARTGQLMVKEFEQENDQEIVILLDPWLPASSPSAEAREALELAIRFAATVCLDACRQTGRRIILGWTGRKPGVFQGPATVRLMRDAMETLSVMHGTPEGDFAALFDIVPAPVLRNGLVVLVSTRPVDLATEARRSGRLADVAARSLRSRFMVLNAAQGDLVPYFDTQPGAAALRERWPDGASPELDRATVATSPTQEGAA